MTYAQLVSLDLCLADCEWKEKEITVSEGEAVRFLKKFKKVKICEDGKLKYKKIKDVDFTLACNGKRNFSVLQQTMNFHLSSPKIIYKLT